MREDDSRAVEPTLPGLVTHVGLPGSTKIEPCSAGDSIRNAASWYVRSPPSSPNATASSSVRSAHACVARIATATPLSSACAA